MSEGPAVQGPLRLRLGDHLIRDFGNGGFGAVLCAVALLRTVFEDHYVDPDHHTSLFFHGCTVNQGVDFSVIHRGDRVVLTDFEGPWRGPSTVSMPLQVYALHVVRFGQMVLARGVQPSWQTAWRSEYVQTQWVYLRELVALGRRYVLSGCGDFQEYFHEVHGHLKRPLELQVVGVLAEEGPFKPASVLARILFGPLKAGEVLPARLNGGNVVRATVERFTSAGAELVLEGVGSGGVCPGDRLFGLQLFYP